MIYIYIYIYILYTELGTILKIYIIDTTTITLKKIIVDTITNTSSRNPTFQVSSKETSLELQLRLFLYMALSIGL